MTDSTSTQRTHRYLRIAIGGIVVVIVVAMLLEVPSVGWLPSVSHYSSDGSRVRRNPRSRKWPRQRRER